MDDLFLQGKLSECTPAQLDEILADGWRYFGTDFFRHRLDYVNDEWLEIIPLRINIKKFSWRKHQQKLLRKAANNSIVRYENIDINEQIEAIFQKHIERFESNIPENIGVFLGDTPGIAPCAALQCNIYNVDNQLYAASFFGVGDNSITSIYATFDTDYAKHSPGLHTLLAEIAYAIKEQKNYVYLGYAHRVASHYDYKKQFNGLEMYLWNGTWADYAP